MRNLDKPGLPAYSGPTQGWFAYIHHEHQVEWSYDIRKRVAYILSNKPVHEQPIRLACLTHIPTERLPVAYQTAWQAYETAEQTYQTAEQAYETAEQACQTAARAYQTAEQAYETAGRAYQTAEQACQTAGRAYQTAGLAYETARRASETAIVSLVAELVPDAPWDGQQLHFPLPTEGH
jgi:hypothetical protein